MTIFLRHALLVLSYFILGIVFSFPLIVNIEDKIPSGYLAYDHPDVWGDHLQAYSKAYEHRTNISRIFIDVNDPEMCMEQEIVKCKYSVVDKFQQIVFSPYWLVTLFSFFVDSPVIAYNLNLIVSFVITGIMAYSLSKFIVNKNLGRIVGLNPLIVYGIPFFASLFSVLAQKRLIYLFGGQKIGFLFAFSILLIYLTEKWLFEKSKSTYLYLLGGIFMILSWQEQFLMLYGLAFLLTRILWHELVTLKFVNFWRFRFKYWIKYLWFPFLVLILFIINLSSKLAEITNSTAKSGRELEVIFFNSPNLLKLITDKYIGFETNIYIGFGLIIIIAGFCYIIIKLSKKWEVDILLYYLSFFVLLVIISLGLNTGLYIWLYENIPVFKYSRTPTKAFFYVFPIISIVFASLIAKYMKYVYLKKFTIYKLSCWIMLILMPVYVYSAHSHTSISLITLPDSINIPESSRNEKVLYLPLTRAIDPMGSLYEYYNATNSLVSINGYTPFPTIGYEKFIIDYSPYLNTGNFDEQIITDLKVKFGIRYVIILKDYYNHSRMPINIDGYYIENNLGDTISGFNQVGVKKVLDNSSFNVYQL